MKIAILGAGNMGGAIAQGLVRAGVSPETLWLTRRHAELSSELAALGLKVTQDNGAAVADAEVVILAVKPWLVAEVLAPLAQTFKLGTTVISVAAKVSLAALRENLSGAPNLHLVRAMPNTAVALGCGVTALAASSPEGLTCAQALFGKLGLALAIAEEKFAAVTALSGCGIAHALKFLRAGQLAAVEMGLPAELSQQIFAQVMKGAAALVEQPETHAEREIDRVCTPGGLTIQGINALEDAGFTAAVIHGLKASYQEA